jgi:exonuclease III
VFWHGLKAYSGVSLHVHKNLAAEVLFAHPVFDMESRIVTAQVGNVVFASVYVPNGGKDYQVKVDFLNSLARWAREVHGDGKEPRCGDLASRTPTWTCIQRSASPASASALRNARRSTAARRGPGRRRPREDPKT